MSAQPFAFRTPYGVLYVEWQNEYSVRVFTQQGIVQHRAGEPEVIRQNEPLVVSGVAHHVEAYFHNGGCNQPDHVSYGPAQGCEVHGGYQCRESRNGGCYAHHRVIDPTSRRERRIGEWALGRVTTESDNYRSMAVGDVDSHTSWVKITKGPTYSGINATDAKRKVLDPLVPAALQAAARSNPDAGQQAKIAELERLRAAALGKAERLRAAAALADSEAAGFAAELDLTRSAQAAA